jgi:hypothetical protein
MSRRRLYGSITGLWVVVVMETMRFVYEPCYQAKGRIQFEACI